MKSAWTLCVVVFLAAGLVAQTDAAPKPTKKKAAPAITAADIQALKDAIAGQQAALAAQQQQIQELRDELRRRDQAVQQAQTAASDADSKAAAAQAAASQQQQTVTALSSDVTDLKANLNSTAMTLQDTQKTVQTAIESPLALHYKGITITPGGFLAAETVRRSRALAADVNTPFNNLTMPGASQSSISEFFGSGRQSRLSMLAEGKLKMVKLSGYAEGDFLSSAATSNNNQSNSYSFRQRQVWGQAAFDDGWTFTGGQMWSLITETRKGTDNRSEALPMTIDAAYTAGFSWARQYGARLSKNFGNKVWFAVSLEDSQATISSHNNSANFLVGSAGASGGVYNPTITTCSTSLNSSGAPVTTCSPTASYAFNPSPDIVVKLAFEPGFGHYEIFGLYDRFRDRVFPCAEASATNMLCGLTAPSAAEAFNNSRNGGGFGVNARWTIAKHIEFALHGFGGSGIGRYGASGLADASVRADGTLDPIKNYQGMATLEWHGPKLDIYTNVGSEYNGRAWGYDANTGKYVGYGSPNFSNAGCYSETIPQNGAGFLPGSLSGCTGDTRALTEGTIGFWHRIYQGPKGRIQWGSQFSYVNRATWVDTHGFEPHGLDGMFFTSFRYYLP